MIQLLRIPDMSTPTPPQATTMPTSTSHRLVTSLTLLIPTLLFMHMRISEDEDEAIFEE